MFSTEFLASFLPTIFTGNQLAAFLVVICFTAGLNLYATVAMLGLLAHTKVLDLPPGLHMLQSWLVIAVSCVLFVSEFIADKIPVFDLLWNALHTFIRIPAAALITYSATAQLPEWQRLLATLLGSAIAFASHGGKIAARAAVTHSPEPFSNLLLSVSEDGFVVFLTWFASRHPYSAAVIVLIALAIIVLFIGFVTKAMRSLFRDTEDALATKTKPHTSS
jgi:hypothetical protein